MDTFEGTGCGTLDQTGSQSSECEADVEDSSSATKLSSSIPGA